MPAGIVPNSWTKLLQLCKTTEIISSCLINNCDITLQYGFLGSLLKRNVFNAWLDSLINTNEVTVFPLEINNSQSQQNLDSKISEKSNTDIIKSVLRNYCESKSLLGHDLPLGFATYGPCLNHFDKNIKPCQEIDFKKFKSQTRLSIAFFSQPKKSMHWFHYWSKQRYLWWRKFSSIPSKFSMSEVRNIQEDIQQLSLLFEFPWGSEPLESITHYENKFVESLFQDYSRENALDLKQGSAPSLVVCETGLDLAVLAYLSNSFAERWRDKTLKNILHLHYKLVPYKVCILLDAENSEVLKRLKSVAIHLSKELQNSGILLYPTLNSKFTTCIESLFSSFDQMGVPYVIVLSEISLQSGVAGLRNRDTTLQEQVHITELTSKLVKYLKS